jgi:hypothetical protein
MNHNRLIQHQSASDAGRQVLYNRFASTPFILKIPHNEEIETLITKFECDLLSRFWEKVVLTPSPFFEGVPAGIKSTKMGHSIVNTWLLSSKLTGETLPPHLTERSLSRFAGIIIRKHSFTEVRAALLSIKPTNIRQSESILTTTGKERLSSQSLEDQWEKSEDFEEFVLNIWNSVKEDRRHRRSAIGLLTHMRNRGWILCPREITTMIGDFTRSPSDWDIEPHEHLSDTLLQLRSTLIGKTEWKNRSEKSHSILRSNLAVFCTSLSSIKDLTLPLTKDLLDTKDGLYVGNRILRNHWTSLCAKNGPMAMIEQKSNNFEQEIRKRVPEDLRLEGWIKLLAEQCTHHTGANLDPVYKAYSNWIKWLSEFEIIPTPSEVKREHIRNGANSDSTTFRTFIEDLDFSSAKLKNEPLLHMSKVFERLRSEAELRDEVIVNPIRYDLDKFEDSERMKANTTHRLRLPEWIMRELMELIVTRDDNGNFAWSEHVKSIGCTQHITPDGETIFEPLRPAIIYLMLVYPLRAHQVRWLDSGEFDTHIFDFTSGEFISNPNRIKSDRGAGCLQPSRTGKEIEFQVAINKTVIAKRRRSNFSIPFITPECLWVIQQVLEWQKLYGSAPVLVKEVTEPTLEKQRKQDLAHLYPEICPLFRAPSQRSH